MQIHDYLRAERKKSSDESIIFACACYLRKCVESVAIGSKPLYQEDSVPTMPSGLTLSTIAWNWSIGLKQPKATALLGGLCRWKT